MVKKLKSIAQGKSSSGSGLLDSALANAVKDSAQQIWLAGMGAFAKAQEEGGKVFDALVKDGMTLQKKTQGAAEDKISEVSGRMSAMAETVTAKAGQNWDKLESIFESRTAKALSKLGVPTAKDVDALAQRVAALEASAATPQPRAAAVRKKAAPAKTAAVAKKAPVRRAATSTARKSANA